MKHKIIFVCHGNIIRSPVAEHIFIEIIQNIGLNDSFEVDSAGIDDWHKGEEPDPRMMAVAAQDGLVYSHKSRQITKNDLAHFDLIIIMDQSNKNALLKLVDGNSDSKKIHFLREFDPARSSDLAVPDPYYQPIDGFVNVYTIIKRSCYGLMEYLQTMK